MKFEVTLDRGLYALIIDGEKILEDQMLSVIVSKIEQYLKMRYLKDTSNGISKFFKGFKI